MKDMFLLLNREDISLNVAHGIELNADKEWERERLSPPWPFSWFMRKIKGDMDVKLLKRLKDKEVAHWIFQWSPKKNITGD